MSAILARVGRRQRRRRSGAEGAAAPTIDYTDGEGNVLTLRERVSEGSVAAVRRHDVSPGSTAEDRWQRRSEVLFERLAVSWTIAGLPLTGQADLLGRYRMADAETRRWVRETLAEHVRRHQPELDG